MTFCWDCIPVSTALKFVSNQTGPLLFCCGSGEPQQNEQSLPKICS